MLSAQSKPAAEYLPGCKRVLHMQVPHYWQVWRGNRNAEVTALACLQTDEPRTFLQTQISCLLRQTDQNRPVKSQKILQETAKRMSNTPGSKPVVQWLNLVTVRQVLGMIPLVPISGSCEPGKPTVREL